MYIIGIAYYCLIMADPSVMYLNSAYSWQAVQGPQQREYKRSLLIEPSMPLSCLSLPLVAVAAASDIPPSRQV